MTKKGKGGRPAWIERPGDPRVLYTVFLYQSQHEWLKETGGAEWLRAKLDELMARSKKRKGAK